ncbi:SAM-dependent methyltransferase [Methyloferula stellata]|uniref:SAM-dependent methyltransferase n=1 Tax=Methyloferula stellata TaxID=876270 RepID=UPI00036494E0|nr:SAM-dependent methyltransferase [Methyloferula stellata]
MDETIRPGEIAVTLEEARASDAKLYFIGHIRTPWQKRTDCPRQGDREQGPECRIVVDPLWHQALTGIEQWPELQLLYWMNEARRDLVIQAATGKEPVGTFALRSPVRPNPIASSIVALRRVEPGCLIVTGLDCLDMTPLLDIKPHFGEAKPTSP